MTYVNQFLIRKEIPKDLRLKIRRYLEYVLNSKKTLKVDQDEVFSVLNKNLEIKMRAFLNGRILKNIIVFKNFEIDFLSEITKSFKKQTFTVDDNIFTEGDEGGTMYFIVTGLVTILHKETQTYIRDLKQDQYFGEIEFFSQKPRFTTVKSRDFTEVLVLTYETFADVAQESYPEAFVSQSSFLYPLYRKRSWRSKTP